MKILVTGGAGFVGSRLVAEELKKKHEVIATDTSEGNLAPLMGRKGFRFLKMDINDPAMEELVAECDMVFHLAAICNPKEYCIRPDRVLEVNIGGTCRMSGYCLKHGKKIVFSSSSEIYGKNPNVPWNEDAFSVMSTNQIRWCYSASKIAGEHYIRAYASQGLKYAIGRFFNFYGPDLKGRVIHYFLERFLKGEDVLVVAPGDQTRCFTYIDDAIEGFLAVAHRPEAENDVFNIGDNRETTVWELASMMKRIGGFKSRLRIVEPSEIYEPGYDDIPRRVPDITKIKDRLGWKPRFTLEDGLARTIGGFTTKSA